MTADEWLGHGRKWLCHQELGAEAGLARGTENGGHQDGLKKSRHQSPTAGAWLTEEHAAFAAGDQHLRPYVGLAQDGP